MPQMLQQLQFSVCSFSKHCSRERLHDLLDGDGLASVGICGRANQPERTHTDWIKVSVAVGDFKDSAKDLGPDEFLVGSHCFPRESLSVPLFACSKC